MVNSSDTRCPFCFPAAIAPGQLLVTAEHFYLLAAAGQIVEGFLTVTTHACRDNPVRLRCLDDILPQETAELSMLRELVTRFYADEYDAAAVFYEHGRGGGYASSLPGGDFVFHPHLCALPGDYVVHEPLQDRFFSVLAPPFPTVRAEIGRRPYLYVHTPGVSGYSAPVVYYGGDLDSQDRIGEVSIKKILAQTNGLCADPDWRRYPGHGELATLVPRFNRWYATTFRRSSDPRWTTSVDLSTRCR